MIQICRILEYLHSLPRPVVHQDVKPANLILEAHLGEVRLVDFGTARAEIPEGATPGSGARASVYGTEGYAPVSYTHLDVYKRQVSLRTIRWYRGWWIRGRSRLAMSISIPSAT